MGKKRNKKAALPKQAPQQAPQQTPEQAPAPSVESAPAPSVESAPEPQPEQKDLPAAEDIFARNEEPSVIDLLNEKLAPLMLKQREVEATMAEQREYLKRVRAERWYQDHLKAWLEGEGAHTEVSDTYPQVKALNVNVQDTVRAFEKTLPPEYKASHFSPLTRDVERVEHIMEILTRIVAKNWPITPEGDFKDAMLVMYGVCLAMRFRIGFRNKLLEGELHAEVANCFATQALDMLAQDSNLWVD